MQEQEATSASKDPPAKDDPSLRKLPPLLIDGTPTPVEMMTQAQLRAFIPLMLKHSTGRGKPGWGMGKTRPVWWPKDLPWANIRSDLRTYKDKQKVSWTHALRQIVINCYKYHGQEDYLSACQKEDDKEKTIAVSQNSTASIESIAIAAQGTTCAQPLPAHSYPTMVQAMSNPNGPLSPAHSYPTMVQNMSNPNGPLSLFQVDPTNPVDYLPYLTASRHNCIP